MLYRKSNNTQKSDIEAIFGNVDGCSDAKVAGSLKGQIGSGSCHTVREEGGTSHGRGEEVNCYTVGSLPGIKHRANVGCIFPQDELALFDVLN